MSDAVTCYIHCAFCGAVLDRFDIPVGGRWDYADKWGYLAAKAHEPECPARRAGRSA